jgi:putative endonuclease
MYYTYAIKSQSTNKIYIGQTNDLSIRLKRHNQEIKSKSTSYTKKNQGPWEIIYSEEFQDRKSAKIREKELKSYRGREFIKNLIKTI